MFEVSVPKSALWEPDSGQTNRKNKIMSKARTAATSPSSVFANLALCNALDASSCPIQYVPARSAGEMSKA